MVRFALLAVTLLVLPLSASAQEVRRGFENVTGDVYLFRNNFHNSLLVVTGEGVVYIKKIVKISQFAIR